MTEETNQPITPQPDPLTVGELISLVEAAEFSGLSARYLAVVATSGRLKAKKIARNWVTTKAAVEDYLTTRKFVYPKDETS